MSTQQSAVTDIIAATSRRPAFIGLLAAAIVLSTAVISGGALYVRSVQSLDAELRNDLRRTAVIAAAVIDGDLHQQLVDRSQEGNAIYNEAIEPLRAILQSSRSIRFICTYVLKDGKVYFVLDPTPNGDNDGDGVNDHSFLMDEYDEANDQLLSVLNGGPALTDLAPVEDRWGITFSGYAPFFDHAGKPIGAVGVDIDILTYQERLGVMRKALFLGAALALVCSLLVGWMVMRFGQSLLKAREATRRHTERMNETRADAERANKTKDEFLAVMSHEIRTPLNAVIGLADLLLTNKYDGETKHHLQTIRTSGEHLLLMINDILDHSKIEAGGMVLEQVPFSPSELLDEVRALMVANAEAKGLTLECHCNGPIPECVSGDPVRLRQVMMNLVANAIKFTERGTVTVSLQATKPDGSMTFTVRDTGVGMTADVRERLFQPFMQADTSFTRRYGGSGLGLSISQRLVNLMGGHIVVDSSPNQGSVFSFTVTMPISRHSTSKTMRQATGDYLPLFSGTILIVDDRAVNRMVASALLKRLGFSVEEAESGKQALDRLARPGINAVLLDCEMPDMGGLETVAALRLIEGNERHTPVIAVSAGVTVADRERCRRAGMDGFLSKPVQLESLVAMLIVHLPQIGQQAIEPRNPTVLESGQTPIFSEDVRVTLNSLDDDPRETAVLYEGYLAESARDLSALLSDIVTGEREAVAKRAHSMKGAALTMGLERLAQALERVVAATQEADANKLTALASELEHLYIEARVVLEQERDRLRRLHAQSPLNN